MALSNPKWHFLNQQSAAESYCMRISVENSTRKYVFNIYSVYDYSPTTPYNNSRISTLLKVLSTCHYVDRKVIN